MKESEKTKEFQKLDCPNKHGVNTGHLTHIEKGDRKPSHKILKIIAGSLGVPYQTLFSTYDKELNKDQLDYHYINHVIYNKVPAISKIDGYLTCPPTFSNASFAFKVRDHSMDPILHENSYVFVEINGLIHNKEIGLFRYNNEILIRKLIYKKDHFVLKANDKKFKDITISDSDNFEIIGKIYI